MLEIDQNKREPRERSNKVNFRNASNAILGGQKEVLEPVASKKIIGQQ